MPMRKFQLDNAYDNIFKDDDIFAITLPLVIIYKKMFNLNEEVLRQKYNLLHSELDVLATLFFDGEAMSPTELYESTIFSSGGMTKVLKKLENKEYISRIHSKNDKRSKLVKIEPKGKEIVQKCLVDVKQNDNKIFSILTKDEKKILKQLFKKVVYNLIER